MQIVTIFKNQIILFFFFFNLASLKSLQFNYKPGITNQVLKRENEKNWKL